MKTLQALVLNLLNHQSSSIFNLNNKNKWTHLMSLMVIVLLMPFQMALANQFPDEFDNYMNVTVNPLNPYNTIDVHLLALDTDGNNERYENCVFSYTTDNWVTFEPLLTYDVTTSAMNFANNIGYTWSKSLGTQDKKGNISDFNIAYEGQQIYVSFKWHFPYSVVGKNLKVRMNGNWIRDYDQGKPLPGMWNQDRDVALSQYNPLTSPKIVPNADGKYKFSWTGAYTNILPNSFKHFTSYDLYSDADFTKLVHTSNDFSGTPDLDAGFELMKLGLFNTKNTYYVKQNYFTYESYRPFLKYEKKITTPISHDGYKYPTGPSKKEDLNTGDITLSWQALNTVSTELSKYYIKRDGVLITPAGLYAQNYTDAGQLPWKNYTYTIYTVPDIWTDKNTVIPELSTTINASTIPAKISFDAFTIKGYKGTNPYIKVSWDNKAWYAKNTIKLYRKDDNTNEWNDLCITNTSTYYTDVKEIVENKYYSYKLVVDQWGKKDSVIKKEMVADKVSITQIAATKNTFGDRINLQWTIDKISLCDRFEIYRSFSTGIGSWSPEILVNQLTAQTLFNSWDDRDAAPGTIYNYKVSGIKKTASLDELKTDSTDIGFRMPVGVVTGRITYGAGTAVDKVSLNVSSSTGNNNTLYKSLKFIKNSDQGAALKLSTAKHGCIFDKGFTFQAWVKPQNRNNVATTIFELEKEYSIRMNSDNVVILLGSNLTEVRTYKMGTTISENTYFNLSVSYKSNKELKIFINGVMKDSVNLTAVQVCSFTNATKCMLANNTSVTKLPFDGSLDDVRLWNRGITKAEVASNYNRYLGGTETGLIGYWPMDEGIGTYAFDCSKTDNIYNENHFIKIVGATSDSDVPKTEELAIKGLTDANGNYIIRGIPFTGDGSTYSITPNLGTHKFEPQQQLRYVSASSLIHNGTDFVDKSAFPVKISVKYKDTDYPVEGVSFSIDDNPVAKENKLVYTDMNGNAEIDVPIGEHYINATLIGHTFNDNGRLPSIGKIIVDENIQAQEFIDNTLVSITGRVAGGVIESSKVVGFKKGVANIGKGTIIIRPAKLSNYSLNNTGTTKRLLNSDSNNLIQSTSNVVVNPVDKYSQIEINTDSITGEYFVMVPPIKEWDVIGVQYKAKKKTQDINPLDYNKTICTNPLLTSADTLTVENKVDSFKYNVKHNFIHRVKPTLNVIDFMGKNGAFGDETYIIRSDVNLIYNDTVQLYNEAGTYTLEKPVFTMGEMYTLKIESYEEFFNKDSISTKVPTAGATITVENQMGKLFKSAVPNPADDVIPVHEMKLNSKGYIYYQFLAGFPKFTSPKEGLGMTVNMQYDKGKVAWEKNSTFKGIVLGYEPIGGANFVTKGPGPLVPLVVLRDPPGSKSYAYLDKGTTVSYKINSKTNINGSFSNKNSLKFGTNTSLGVGLGFMVITEVETENSASIGLEGEYASFRGESTSKTLTISEKVKTSSLPEFVGSNADVYIGTSTNVFSTNCNWLEIKKSNNTCQLNQTSKETTSIEAATEFRFSQNEILTAQIPAWQKRIKDNLDSVSATEYANPAQAELKNRYITRMSPTNANYGMDKTTYKVVPPLSKEVIGNEIDSMATHIRNWRGLIQRNEETKYVAKNDAKAKTYEKTNISLDAGAIVERSYTYTTSVEKTNGKSRNTQSVIGGNIGFEIGGNGVDVSIEAKFGGGKESNSSSTTASTTSFGFVLADDDTDNRFSINVYKNKFLSSELKDLETDTTTAIHADASVGSYIFELAAGSTSCPYEGVDSTLFYKGKNTAGKYLSAATDPLLLLAVGSQALDVPKLDITSGNVKTDVPNGKEASFTIQLESGSTGYSPRLYRLSVDETTNKDGAIISVDGTPLTEAREYYITKGVPLTKTLSLRQTKLDVLDYKNIKLLFASQCDDIKDEKNISVQFVPSCSDLDLVIDQPTMNVATGSSVLLKMKNFNQDYKNFMGLKIEYKLDGEQKWKEKIFAKKGVDFGNITPESIIPETVSAMEYRLDLVGRDDGRYQVRAMTLCKDPNSNSQINNITPEFIVVKDMVRPASMGTPSPSNGILTPESEVAVTFNESLQTNRLVPTDLNVEGVLNGATLQHGEGLALDGSANSLAYTESSISLQEGSFAIEGWVQMKEVTAMGNLFSIGEGANKLTLKMNKSSIALFINDIQVGVTESIAQKAEWQYVSVNYDANNKTIKTYVLNSTENQTKISTTIANGLKPEGRLIIGSNFKGNIHQVAVWNTTRSLLDLNDMNFSKSGTESNIIGYWPMDEAAGTLAADKVRSRNMIVNSTWFISPSGKSAVFNGNNSVLINTTNKRLSETDNFSLELWFNGNTQKDKTIFSCGKGIGDAIIVNNADENINNKLSVGFDNAGDLNIYTKSANYVVPNTTVLDGKWHHFAMSVQRGGNANIYIDGLQKLQIPSIKIGGLAADIMSIGSRSYSEMKTVNNVTSLQLLKDQCFTGKIDEVRIWKSALSSENFRLDMRSKIDSTASGLIAYYPFEKVLPNGTIEGSIVDFSKGVTGAASAENWSYDDNTPGIKMNRQKVKVIFDYTVSNNKIVFNINETLKKIENCVLEFSINKVLDMNGNDLTSPIKWTAFVNNNRLNWETENVSITKQVLDAFTFKAVIVNNSGKYENYVIDGLPSWVSVNASSGKLNPLEKKELTFTIDPATNIGSYESRIILTGNNNMQDLLPVSLKVTGPRPDWTVNPYGSESSMNVVGQIKIGGVYQEDKEDIMAAFMGTRCVGLASPVFDKERNGYYLYMDIYGNASDNNQALTYSLWDAGTGRIYPGVDLEAGLGSFTAAAIIGTIESPKTFNATDKVEQQLSLKQGWNWLSTNVVSTTPSLIDQFKAGIGTVGEQLKSKNDGFIDYSSGAWYGTLQSLNQTSMYMLKTNEAKTVKMVGAMAKPESFKITLNTEWNYIGYLPSFVAPLKEALSGLTPKTGDQIKGQVGFASYSGTAWYGSLQYMMPGLGYMYNSKNPHDTIFYYPSQYLSSSKVIRENNETVNMKWPVDANKYQMSMTVTGIASINGSEVANSDIQMGVFVDNECRGTVSLKYIDSYNRYMAFIMVWGNLTDANKKITFKSYNPNGNQELIAVNESLTFVPDNIVGSPASPYKISFISSGKTEVDMNRLKVYPNPVTDMLHFDYDPSEIQQLEVVDNMGRVLISNTRMIKNSVNVQNLVPGVYTLRIKHNGNLTNHFFIRK